MLPLIFVLGALLGLLAGGAMCIRYLRREISADIGPQLRRVRLQLDNLEAAVNLALMTRYSELSAPPHPAASILSGPPTSSGSQ
jgi:hypothetical protein